MITGTTVRGVTGRWHERWLDYRDLSAQLRHMRALTLVGSNIADTSFTHPGEDARPGPMWVNWYCRMITREIGILNVVVDDAYVRTAKVAICLGEIKDQCTYHGTNAARMGTIARRLDIISVLSFAATFLICGYEVAGNLGQPLGLPSLPEPGSLLHHVLYILTVVLPAFGAALFGIRMYGDFEGSAERSQVMMRLLGKVVERMEGESEMSFAELSAITEYSVTVMASELGDWSLVYRGRPLALPT